MKNKSKQTYTDTHGHWLPIATLPGFRGEFTSDLCTRNQKTQK